MVRAKGETKLDTDLGAARPVIGSYRQSLVMLPLGVIAVFTLIFVQMSAMNAPAKQLPKANVVEVDEELPALPLIVQPDVPQLNTSVETITPPPSAPPADPYVPSLTGKPDKVGPSPVNAGNVLQSVGNQMNKGMNDELQATRKSIRLEEAKL